MIRMFRVGKLSLRTPNIKEYDVFSETKRTVTYFDPVKKHYVKEFKETQTHKWFSYFDAVMHYLLDKAIKDVQRDKQALADSQVTYNSLFNELEKWKQRHNATQTMHT